MTGSRIGFLAPAPLTNGYTAAVRFAAHVTGKARGIEGMKLCPLKSHADIIQAATNGAIDYGVIAVENTLDGIIIESIRELERLFETERERRPYICWEELLPIRHVLINQSGRFQDIRRIASHASALRQCSRFLSAVQRALPGVEITQALSTGQGVKDALTDSSIAAMASPEALEHHGMELRAVDLASVCQGGVLDWPDPQTITDFRDGFTRFWILGPQPAPAIPPPENRIRVTQRDQLAQITGTRDHHLQKTCYLLNLPDAAGAMHRALGCFASRGISVAVLYPYPRLQRTFEYLFFAEIEGHCDDLLVAEAEREINDRYLNRPIHERPCILLGSYPNTPLLLRQPASRTAFRQRFYPPEMRWSD
jgi:chorismate mutase/prephenate dehydratase